MIYTERSDCRVCGGALATVLNLGDLWIINFGDKPQHKAPLELVKCENCHIVQLKHTVDPEYLFREYYYASGINTSMREHLKEMVTSAMNRLGRCSDKEVVVDIGANDGTLLSYVNPASFSRVGFEPAKNVPHPTEEMAWVNDFFSLDAYETAFVPPVPRAKMIFAISMFYDLKDPNKFLKDVKAVMADDGLFVIQQNYLPAMLRQNAFDNIVHEHLFYYSVTTMRSLLERNGFYIQEVEFNDTNGGSFRTYIRKLPGGFTSESVVQAMKMEAEMYLDKPHVYKDFAAKTKIISKKIHGFVQREVEKGNVFFIAGASTRGNTLLQVADLDYKLIQYAVERNPIKWGMTIPWAHIDIVSEKMADEEPPNYYLVLPWQFFGEFFMRELKFLRNGGKFLIPLPRPAVVSVEEL